MNKHKRDMMHLDADETAFFNRQLEYVKAKTYDSKYKDLKAFSLIPVSNEAPAGATEITWRKYSGVGFAKIIQDYANDFPRVDVYGVETTTKVRGIGAAYGYNITEIRRSQMAGIALDQKKANMARRAIEQLINSIAFTGDTTFNIYGLINQPGITEYTVPNDGTGTTKTWSTKTADQIVRDLMGMIGAVVNTTNGRESPTTLILPITQYLLIAGMKMSTNSDKTVLRYFLENNGFITKVDWVSELYHAGGSSTDRMMVYANDEDHLTLEIPQPFEQFDADKDGMDYEIPCHAETAGVLVYYPLAIAFGDGI